MIGNAVAHDLGRRGQHIGSHMAQGVERFDRGHEAGVENHIVKRNGRQPLGQRLEGHVMIAIGTEGTGQRIVRTAQVVLGDERLRTRQALVHHVDQFGRKPSRTVSRQRDAVGVGRSQPGGILQDGLHDGRIGRILIAVIDQYLLDRLAVAQHDLRQRGLLRTQVVRAAVEIDQHADIVRQTGLHGRLGHLHIGPLVAPQVVVGHHVHDERVRVAAHRRLRSGRFLTAGQCGKRQQASQKVSEKAHGFLWWFKRLSIDSFPEECRLSASAASVSASPPDGGTRG